MLETVIIARLMIDRYGGTALLTPQSLRHNLYRMRWYLIILNRYARSRGIINVALTLLGTMPRHVHGQLQFLADCFSLP
jgi:hypothetical protein